MTPDEQAAALAWLDALRLRIQSGEVETVLAFEVGEGVVPAYLGAQQPAKLVHSIGLGIMQGAVDAVMSDGGGEELIRLESSITRRSN